MAAYAALVSLSHILHQIMHPPLSLHITTIPSERVATLREKVSFLIDFLESFPSRRNQEIKDVEKRIIDAAYEAEDIIESDVVMQIQSKHPILEQKTSFKEKIKRFLPIKKVFKKKETHLCISYVIKKFISIQKELVEIKNRSSVEDLRPYSARSHPSGMDIMVGFDEHLDQIRIALVSNDSCLRVVPIVGMGGIGKTTLATNVYKDPYIIEYFDIHAWVRVSQEYRAREMVLALLEQIESNNIKREELSAEELGNLVHKTLFGRRYLIVLDDMWDIQAWDELKWFLPDNNNGSRILVTTRILKLGVDLGSHSPYQIEFLNEHDSWDLILEMVFGKEECPSELEEIGKNIARKCGGLPLALVVIGGLLAKSEKKARYWHSIAQDVTSAVNNEDNHYFMKLLSLSYSHLPINLKPCFLYLAAFPEDYEIKVSRLLRLWVAEGLIKLTKANTLEEVAKGYLDDLIDRNLIRIGRRGSSGRVKTCKIHDLLRDLCVREAHKDKFLCVAKLESRNVSPFMGKQRRLSIHYDGTENKVWKALQSAKLNRSLLSYSNKWNSGYLAKSFRLLRVMDGAEGYVGEQILHKTNLRYVRCTLDVALKSASRLWNLQTLVVDGKISLPAQIWEMTQLRHIKITEAYLHDPSPDTSLNSVVLENLQTLSMVKNFKCNEQIVNIVPNLEKLRVSYGFLSNEHERHYLRNLECLSKLESLRIRGDQKFWGKVTFPSSLKKLVLSFCNIPWEDMPMIGSLPNLEVLKLLPFAAKGHAWRPNEGDFGRLKFLLIYGCSLEIWEADNTHFPRLECLYLRDVGLKEIPIDFAEIVTLQVIGTNMSSISSLWISANEISKQRESLGYELLQLVYS